MHCMFKMKRALALVCTINMLFGNLSLDSFVMAESPAMVMEDPSAQVVAEVPSEMEADKAEKETRKDGDESSPRKDDTKVEVIDNPMDQVSVVSISLGDTRVITLDTVLVLNIGATQRIAIAADAPVNVNVSRNGGRPVTYTYNNGKLETTFEAAAGSYELSFSSDQHVGAFTVRVENARSYVAENAGVKIENKDQSEKPEKKNKSDKAEEQNTGDASVTGETSAPAETVVETTLEIPEADTAVSTGSGSEAAGDTNDAADE
ncbi:MAG: hypothetical protein IJ719_15485, partial [Clostridia bacterium]|nr:hypothetical protein [Clostridia bacterium]